MRWHVFQYFIRNNIIFFILQKWATKSANSSQKCLFKFNIFVFFGNKLFRGEANFSLVISENARGGLCNGCRVMLLAMYVILSISLVKFCHSRYKLDQRNFLVLLISHVQNLHVRIIFNVISMDKCQWATVVKERQRGLSFLRRSLEYQLFFYYIFIIIINFLLSYTLRVIHS